MQPRGRSWDSTGVAMWSEAGIVVIVKYWPTLGRAYYVLGTILRAFLVSTHLSLAMTLWSQYYYYYYYRFPGEGVEAHRNGLPNVPEPGQCRSRTGPWAGSTPRSITHQRCWVKSVPLPSSFHKYLPHTWLHTFEKPLLGTCCMPGSITPIWKGLSLLTEEAHTIFIQNSAQPKEKAGMWWLQCFSHLNEQKHYRGASWKMQVLILWVWSRDLRVCISDKLAWTTLSCARDNSHVSPGTKEGFQSVRVWRTLRNYLAQRPHGADRERGPARVRHMPKVTQWATGRDQVFRLSSVLLPLPPVCSRNLRQRTEVSRGSHACFTP